MNIPHTTALIHRLSPPGKGGSDPDALMLLLWAADRHHFISQGVPLVRGDIYFRSKQQLTFAGLETLLQCQHPQSDHFCLRVYHAGRRVHATAPLAGGVRLAATEEASLDWAYGKFQDRPADELREFQQRYPEWELTQGHTFVSRGWMLQPGGPKECPFRATVGRGGQTLLREMWEMERGGNFADVY